MNTKVSESDKTTTTIRGTYPSDENNNFADVSDKNGANCMPSQQTNANTATATNTSSNANANVKSTPQTFASETHATRPLNTAEDANTTTTMEDAASAAAASAALVVRRDTSVNNHVQLSISSCHMSVSETFFLLYLIYLFYFCLIKLTDQRLI